MMGRAQWKSSLVGVALIFGLAGCGAATAQGAAANTGAPSAQAGIVKTRSLTLAGKTMTVLTTAAGRTLYWFTADTRTTTHCTGGCAGIWPPLLATGTSVVTPPSLPGHLTVVKDALGNQVAYNGYLLYTYVADTAPGQAHGQGLHLNGGVWWVITAGVHPRPTSSASSSTGSSSSSSSSGGGYGG
ncbi:MAG: COG4315 family predicted lipoprotein [Clostridia bacterium]